MAGRGAPLRVPPLDHLSADEARQQAEQAAWDDYRAAHPARFAAQALERVFSKRPGKSTQRDWTLYTYKVAKCGTRISQQHLVVPVLAPQPLAGQTPQIADDPSTAPFAHNGREHVSNIRRVGALLNLHPQVGAITLWKPYKALDNVHWLADGRCRGHSGRPPESARPARRPRSLWRGHGNRHHGERHGCG